MLKAIGKRTWSFLAALVKIVAALVVAVWTAVCKFVADLFTDFRGWVDEKRFWGNVLMALGVWVVIVNAKAPGPYVWIVAGGLISFGVLILGIAGAQDVKANVGRMPDSPSPFGTVVALLVGAKESARQAFAPADKSGTAPSVPPAAQ